MVEVGRANTILYTDAWVEMVRFYRDTMALEVEFENDWFVELNVSPGTYVSVADASRTTIAPGDGAGLTLSWQVDDVYEARSGLLRRGATVGEVAVRWGAEVLDIHDPAGNRIELWSDRRIDAEGDDGAAERDGGAERDGASERDGGAARAGRG